LEGYGRGDEYVIIKVVTPTDLSEEKTKLLRQFDALGKQRESGTGLGT
jgi:molecular chaperone DnaJ